MANPVAVNEKGLTVLYEAPQPVVEYVLFHARFRSSTFLLSIQQLPETSN